MQRKTGQLWALFIVMMLLVFVVGYQMYSQTQLQTSVTQPQQGYPDSGYPPADPNPPDVPPLTPPTDPDAHPPLTSEVIGNGILQLSYLVGFGSFVKVDGLQVPQHVRDLSTEVRWINDTQDNLNFTLDDEVSVRTHFVAPQSEGEIVLVLMVKTARGLNPVARYVFEIVSPLVLQSDFNSDGHWDFKDLVILLQSWEDLQPQSTQIMSVLLSRYEN